MVNERAVYQKYMSDGDEGAKVDVQIPSEQFELEARDFQYHNISEFYKSSQFTKLFRVDGRNIKTIQKV